jgi:hypothetical protein
LTTADRGAILAPKRLPSGSRKPSEFKRYQQALAAVYIGTISAGALLLAASVVKGLFFRPVVQPPVPALVAGAPDPIDLLRCHEDVARLHGDLERNAADLLTPPLRGRTRDVLPLWEAFEQEWLEKWEEVNGWCRFSELAGTRLGEASDLLANVHSDLLAIRLKYQSLLVQFDKELAAGLADTHRALDRSRVLIVGDERAQGANSEEAP